MSVLPFPEARHMVEQHARAIAPPASEVVSFVEACGRVLAEQITADRDLPPFPRAIRDGYAVRAADLGTLPARLTLVAEIKAGAPAELSTLAEGEAAEIMTGAPVPPGADAVVMVEYTSRDGAQVEISRGIAPGENFVPRGAEARAGQPLLVPGTRLGHAAIALAASVGKAHLRVYRRPRIAVLATGDELVEVSATPGPHQIRNSNTWSLAAQVAAAGGQPVVLPVAPDEHGPLRALIEEGLRSDLLLLSGGVSMGKYDLVEQVLAEFDAEFFFTGTLIQPGRPTVFGRARECYFFGLPGNPISTMVTFELFARVMLNALAGAAPQPLIFVSARLKSDFRTKTGLTRFLPAMLTGEFERGEVEPVRWQGSGDIAATARANCYLVVPPERELIPAGEMVSVLVVR